MGYILDDFPLFKASRGMFCNENKIWSNSTVIDWINDRNRYKVVINKFKRYSSSPPLQNNPPTTRCSFLEAGTVSAWLSYLDHNWLPCLRAPCLPQANKGSKTFNLGSVIFYDHQSAMLLQMEIHSILMFNS